MNGDNKWYIQCIHIICTKQCFTWHNYQRPCTLSLWWNILDDSNYTPTSHLVRSSWYGICFKVTGSQWELDRRLRLHVVCCHLAHAARFTLATIFRSGVSLSSWCSNFNIDHRAHLLISEWVNIVDLCLNELTLWLDPVLFLQMLWKLCSHKGKQILYKTLT